MADGHTSVLRTSGMTLRKWSLLKVRHHEAKSTAINLRPAVLGKYPWGPWYPQDGTDIRLLILFGLEKGLKTLRKWLMPPKHQKIVKGLQPKSLSTPIRYYCNNWHNQPNSHSWLPTALQSDCHLTTTIKQICEGAFCVMYILWSERMPLKVPGPHQFRTLWQWSPQHFHLPVHQPQCGYQVPGT